MKKIVAFFVCICLLCSLVNAQEYKNKTEDALLSLVSAPTFGDVGGEWTVIALARSGASVPDGFYASYYGRIEELLKKNNGILSERKMTEYSRVVLALTAIGKDPRNVAGYNLLAPLGDFSKVIFQGINGSLFALLALDSGNYEMPAGDASRAMYLEEILKSQHTDGGWGLGQESEADITAMALCAIHPYRETEGVKEAIEGGLSYISSTQNERGGFLGFGEETLESSAWVLIALSTLGISHEDERFVKEGNSTIDFLLSFSKDGAFSHTKGGEIDIMSTEQGLLALAALSRKNEGKAPLFQMEDAVDLVGNTEKENNRHRDVRVNPVTMAGKTFADISGHSAQTAIEDLASRGIINGKDENSFDPNSTMTRAEFATIVVRALGLPVREEASFLDVSPTDWFYGFVASASHYGIVNGVGEGKFNPYGTITREEAAVMVGRAASLCGLENTLGEAEIMDILTLFTDYPEVSSWAREKMAFCFDAGILSDEQMEILPKTAVLRFEIAEMLWNLLKISELI